MKGIALYAIVLFLVNDAINTHAAGIHGTGSHRRPNIAMIYLDQWRWDWAGFDEPDVDMPTVRLLASRGTRFDHAYVPSSLCVPSRCAMAAGKNYQNMWVKDNHANYYNTAANSSESFMSLLRKAGYTTIMAGKDHLSALSGVGQNGSHMVKEIGFDLFTRSMDKYEFCAVEMGDEDQAPYAVDQYGVFLMNRGLWKEQCEMYGPYARGASCNATQVCSDDGGLECGFHCTGVNRVDQHNSIDSWAERSAEALLEAQWDLNGKEVPWFLELGFPSPHPPFISSAEHYARTANKSYPLPIDVHFNHSKGSPGQHVDTLASRREYAAVLEMVDTYLARFVQFLENNDQYNDTVIILLADHGEFLGDHTEYSKSAAWEQAVRVPLIFSGPGVGGNRVVHEPVATLDAVGTILEIAGTQPIAGMETQSLLPVIRQGSKAKPSRDIILSALDSATDFNGKAGGYEMALKQFNTSSILKLVCCLTGCIKQGTMFSKVNSTQVVLMQVESGAGTEKFERNVLDIGSGRGVAEAKELIQSLSPEYQMKCGNVLMPRLI
jgi:arylsulfatase A-like enzyme